MIPSLLTLPFVKTDETGRYVSMWSPDTSGTQIDRLTRGHEYANSLIDAMRARQDPTLLMKIVRAFEPFEAGVARDVEVGFLTYLAARLID